MTLASATQFHIYLLWGTACDCTALLSALGRCGLQQVVAGSSPGGGVTLDRYLTEVGDI